MFVFYEKFPGNTPVEDVYEFVLSSDGRTNKISFYDKKEKREHALVTEFIKNIPLTERTYDATTHVTCILGTMGATLLTVLESSITRGLLTQTKIKQISNLQQNLQRGNLSYIPPKVNTKAPEVVIEFNEEEFFHKPETKSSELSGPALYKALAKILGVPESSLKTLDPSELKKIYRRRCLDLHPDRNGGDGSKMAELTYLWRLYNA